MKRTPVESSQLAAVAHNPATNTLHIEFHGRNGQTNPVYEYTGVPAAAHAALMMADSKGRHFKNEIRGKYPYRKIS